MTPASDTAPGADPGAGTGATRLWGGRFSGGPSPQMTELSLSVHFDWRLAPYDVLQTRAHAGVLQRAGLLDDAEYTDVLAALARLATEVADGSFVEKLKQQVQVLEQKRRRHDVLIDDTAQAKWYEQHVPEAVLSTASLEKWLKKERDPQGRRLFMTADELMLDSAQELSNRNYPDFLEANKQRFAINYRFDPGAQDDGATIMVPLETLNQLDPDLLEWLVPGYRLDKAEALIRSLPKPKRRPLTPTAEFAAKALAQMDPVSGLSFRAALCASLEGISGLTLHVDDFDSELLPDYLKFRVVVTDSESRVLASCRDFEQIQQRFGAQALRRFMDRQGRDWNRDGQSGWTFGEVPDSCRTDSGGVAYPALVDQADSVGLRLFDTAQDAAISHIEGVRRLLGIKLRDKLKWLQKNHGLKPSELAAWTARGSAQQLVEAAVAGPRR